MENNWQVEGLIKRALVRTKTKFLSYFLALIINIGLWVGYFLAALVVFGICFFLWYFTKSVILVAILAVISVLLLISLSIYIQLWVQLAMTSIIIQKENLGTIETFKKVKPLIKGFFWFSTIYSLFILGLVPYSIFTFLIILLLWLFWGSFSTFVYLEKQKKGLENLWISRAMINQKFWGILGRMLLIIIGAMLIGMILGSSKNQFVNMTVSLLINLFITPFMISFSYEMYKNLSEPVEVKKPKIWIVLSIIGGILMIIIFAFAYMGLINYAVNFKSNPVLPKMPFDPSLLIPSLPALPSEI